MYRFFAVAASRVVVLGLEAARQLRGEMQKLC